MEKEKQTLFRQSAIDRMQGPEDLNGYIKVTTTSAWLLLAAIIALLAGLFAWGFLGSVEVVDANGASAQVRPIEWVLGK